ncbi:facilitated trehalose transporter Tret1 [Trichonephila clavata]|uniref:Facilitated trehalose transporter Tret1 n=1 Tax=Trichonephila clavata TaxID=2740835 RepID=A0A8X6M479_TRICU|nr:facilitated trehalose transporter Tret1 [Trichonephila clavata]
MESVIPPHELVLDGSKLRRESIPLESPVEENLKVQLIEPDEDSDSPQKIRKMYFAALSALLMGVAMGTTIGYTAPATYDMKNRPDSPFKPSTDDITWIGSALAIGSMPGSLVAGPLADKIGRKSTLIVNILPFVVGWLTISFAKTVGAVIAGRLICGFASGVISVAVPMYCVEISTSKVRGLLGASFQGFVVIGQLVSVIIGSYVSWEFLALAGAGVVTLSLFCFIPFPESPRWLLAHDERKEAVCVMRDLHGVHMNVEEECTKILTDLKNQPKGFLTLNECKHPTIYKPAVIATILMFFHQFSGSNAVLFYSSTIFEASKEFMDPEKSSIILGAVQVVVTLFSNNIVDRAGRKILLILSSSLMSVSLTVLGTYYYISADDKVFQLRYDWIPLCSLISFLFAFALGFGSIPALMAAEMIPLRARSTIGGLILFANSTFAFIITKTFSELEDLVHNYGTFWTYAALSLVGCFFVILVVPETKGKELEDIANYFNKKKKNDPEISVSVLSKK